MTFTEALDRIVEGAQTIEDRTDALVESKASVQDFIKHFKAVSDAYDKLSDAKKKINEQYDRLSTTAIPDRMREDGIKSMRVEGIGNCVQAHRYSASIIDKDRAYHWLRTNGADALITATVNSATLSAYAKERFTSDGKELPADIFKVSTQVYTQLRK